ncbi:MAG: hypothetical protein JOZ89_10460 [Gammaproteobacteria bacterium]|nr:hypothetical protein [Gammaproteobacteria bacterium]
MNTLTIGSRFCGPPNSSNGGYFAGLVATLASRAYGPAVMRRVSGTLEVRLLKPPPLDTELSVQEGPEGVLQVLEGAEVIGEARPAALALEVRRAPGYLEAVEASRHYAGFRHHRFATCFVCGTRRARGDGLRIFAGPLPERGMVAAPWVPDSSLDGGDGKVRPEFMSAALDCPGYYAVAPDDRMMLLAEFTAHVDRLVHIGASCTLIGWHLNTTGRKREAGTAIFDGKGELCGRARALWVEPRSGATVRELPTPVGA